METLRRWVYDALEAGEGLGNWLQDLDWFSSAGGEGAVTGASISALGVYLLAPQSLRVPMGTDHDIFKLGLLCPDGYVGC